MASGGGTPNEWPEHLPNIKGRLIMTDHSGSKTFHAPKRAFYALGTNRADLHCLYVAKDEADVFSDPEDVLHLFSTSRVFQFGDSEFSIVNPSYSLTLKCAPEALRGWILTLNAVVDLYPLISLQSIHQFSRVHFNKPTWCRGCSDFIWGLGYQGFECISCKRPYHPKCMLAATPDCPGR